MQEAVGTQGVDKRLDVLATAITAKMTVEDICHLELAYAPPFGSAKDVVNIAGFAACNQRDGLVRTVSRLPANAGVQIIDVRGKPVADASPVPGAVNIPMTVLRDNLDRIDQTRPVVTVLCARQEQLFRFPCSQTERIRCLQSCRRALHPDQVNISGNAYLGDETVIQYSICTTVRYTDPERASKESGRRQLPDIPIIRSNRKYL